MGVPEMWSTSKMTMYMGLMDDKPLGLGGCPIVRQMTYFTSGIFP